MSNENLNEAIATLAAALAAASGDQTDQQAVTSADTEETRAAQQVRTNQLIEVAKPLANQFWEVYTAGDLEFDVEVVAQMAWNDASRARYQHFWSRNMADYQARLLADEQDRGYRYGDVPNPEVNPAEVIENALQYHLRNMEQYEVLMYAADLLWSKANSAMVANGKEPGKAPNVDISEKAYSHYANEQRDRRMKAAAANRDASMGAHSFTVRTQNHFITKTEA